MTRQRSTPDIRSGTSDRASTRLTANEDDRLASVNAGWKPECRTSSSRSSKPTIISSYPSGTSSGFQLVPVPAFQQSTFPNPGPLQRTQHPTGILRSGIVADLNRVRTPPSVLDSPAVQNQKWPAPPTQMDIDRREHQPGSVSNSIATSARACRQRHTDQHDGTRLRNERPGE